MFYMKTLLTLNCVYLDLVLDLLTSWPKLIWTYVHSSEPIPLGYEIICINNGEQYIGGLKCY